ncbi:MAG: hypothetical protein ACXWF8_18820 [Methylobacter sp.]
MKKLRFVGSSLDDLKNFPIEAGAKRVLNSMPCSAAVCHPTLSRCSRLAPARMRFVSMRWGNGG